MQRSRQSFFKSFGTFHSMRSLKPETEQERREREKKTYAQRAARNRSLYALAQKQEEINREKKLEQDTNLRAEWVLTKDIVLRSGKYEEKLLQKTKVSPIVEYAKRWCAIGSAERIPAQQARLPQDMGRFPAN